MNRKEKLDLILSKVADDRKEALVAALREAKTRKERGAVLKRFGVALTAEEAAALFNREVSDEELDAAAGGCGCNCRCGCNNCSCSS